MNTDIQSQDFSSAPSEIWNNWFLRIIHILSALLAGYVFIDYLIYPEQVSTIHFKRQPAHLLMAIVSKIPIGEFLFDYLYIISSIAGVLACLLAIILSIIASNDCKSIYLSGALSLGCLSLAYIFYIGSFYIDEINYVIKIFDILAGSLFGLSLWLWIKFIREFPQRVTVENFIKIESSFFQAPSLLPKKMKQLWYKIFVRNYFISTPKVINISKKIIRFILSYKSMLLFILLYALVGVSANDITYISPGLFMIFRVLLLSLASAISAYSIQKIIANYRYVDEQSRKQISWLFFSLFVFAIVVFVALLSALMLYLLGFSELGLYILFALAFMFSPTFWLLFIIGLMFSIFYKGALDPRLVIKKSTIYGIIGIGITALFVAVEGTLQTHAVLELGLHDQTGAIITGTLATVVMGPLRNKMEDKVEGFVDRILPVSALAEGNRRTSAIVFNDISGYTAISESNEDAALMLVSIIHQVGTKAAIEANGRVVKTIGDAIMLELPTVDDAVLAAKNLHKKYTLLCQQYKLPDLPIHSGIHWGEVVRAKDGDIYGKNVNLAARLEGAAGPAEIVLSQAAVQELSDEYPLKSLGNLEFKNITKSVECFSLSTNLT